MISLVAIIIIQVSAITSILGLYFTLQPPTADQPWWHSLVIAVAIIFSFFLAGREIVNYVRNAPKVYRSSRKIKSYMRKWISSGGRVVIFSRDMSWAGDEATRQILLEKARRDELTVCVERSIPLTDDLRQSGARIVTYEALGHVPRSRFTIVDFDRDGARVAVGVPVQNRHVIQEFRSGDHPYFAVAEDLVKFIIASNHEMTDVSQC